MKLKLIIFIFLAFPSLYTFATIPTDPGLYAKITTVRGEIVFRLHYDKVPLTVANFAGLATGQKENTAKALGVPFYDGSKFHFASPGFAIQGGGPNPDGGGGPGYTFVSEFHESLTHDGPGVVSMFNPRTDENGSQFFITDTIFSNGDGIYPIFGQVVSGQEVVSNIVAGDEMQTITIHAVGEDALAFQYNEVAFQQRLVEFQENREEDRAAINREFLERWPNAVVTESGLRYIITQIGDGNGKPASNASVTAHYHGTLLDGTVFDSSVNRGTPFTTQLGVGGLIVGFEEGLAQMEKGEKRTLIIPPELGYGNRRSGNIPPYSFTIFELEMIDSTFVPYDLVTYSAWTDANFSEGTPSGDTQKLSNPDKDEFPNAFEFAVGMNPEQTDQPPLAISLTVGDTIAPDNRIYFTYDEITDLENVHYRIEKSTDLITWSPATGILEILEINGSKRTVRKAVSYTGDTKIYLRLSVDVGD